MRRDSELAVLAYALFSEEPGTVFAGINADDLSVKEIRGAYRKATAMWKESGKVELSALQHLLDADELAACQVSASVFVPSMDVETEINAIRSAIAVDKAKDIAVKLSAVDSLDDVIQLEGELQKIARGSVKIPSVTYADYMEKFLERKTATLRSYPTGFSKLDNYLVISPGDFVILAGEQSSGKTAFSLELANRFANRGNKVVYFSFETESYKLGDRAFTNWAGLDFNNVKRQDLSGDDWELVSEYKDSFADLPVVIVPSAGHTVEWIKGEAVRQEADIIFVDYLGLIQPSNGKKDKSYEIVSDISKELHTLAQSELITVVALQQQNREGAGKASMHSLRDSSQIESDADAILILTIPKDGEGMTERDRSQEYLPMWEENLNIAKNKDGDRVTISYTFDGQHQKFYERETRYT